MVIAVVDSGIGGLFVLDALCKKYPGEHYIYYSDNLFAPYGIRNAEFLKNRLYEISLFLTGMGAEEIVVACNTMGVTAAEHVSQFVSVPMTWIYPEAYPEFEKTLVMCTPMSAESARVEELVKRGATLIADPRLASIAESAGGASRAAEEYLENILGCRCGYDTVSLGCTHYIYFQETIKRLTGAVRTYDGVDGVVRRAARHITGKEAFRVDMVFSGEDESVKYRAVLGNIAAARAGSGHFRGI